MKTFSSSFIHLLRLAALGFSFSSPIVRAQALDWNIIGGGDRMSLYQEANWLDPATGAAPPAGTVNPNLAINRHLRIRAGSPGGGAGASAHLLMGTGSLTVSHATLRMSAGQNAGIDMGTSDTSFRIIDGHVLTEFIKGGAVTMSGRSELTLYGAGDPLEGTAIELQSPDCYVYLPSILPGAANNAAFIAKFTVNGASTNGNLRVTQYYTGAIIRALPAGNVGLKAFDLKNLQSPLNSYGAGFYGKIGVGEATSQTLAKYTVKGFGDDIWGKSDMFHFVYRRVSGDCEIIAHVDSIENNDDAAKAGVMIRETLDHDSRYALAGLKPNTQAFFHIRLNPGANASAVSGGLGDVDTPKYLRLTRSGTSFSAYYTTDSASGPWTQIGGARTLDMANDVTIGLAVTSHEGALLNTSVFSEVSLFEGGVAVPAGAFGRFDGHTDVCPPFADEDRISSFLLKKGYQVTMSEDAAGQGFSKVYIATEDDILVNLPAGLNNKVSFMRVLPWRWIAKKGWGGQSDKAAAVGAYWNYEWEPTGSSGDNREFVPMIKGRAQNKEYRWEEVRVRGNQTHFLGFNEPMNPNQGDLTVDEAIALWPKAQQLGLRLGSPSRTDGAVGDDWLTDFMQKASDKGYRVDYVCVHNYHQTSANGLKNWLEADYAKYGLPIWLTEFHRDDGTVSQNETYVSEVLQMLEDLPFIERYAYFNFNDETSFFDSNGNLTSLGTIYYNQKSTPAYVAPDYGNWCVVSLTAPANGATVPAGAVNISAEVSLSSDCVASVEFFVDDVSAGVDSNAPYSMNLTGLNEGLATLYAKVTTIFGEEQTSDPVQVIITGQTTSVVSHWRCF